MNTIVALDKDTGEGFVSAAYVGELLKTVRAIESELSVLCAHLERIERERPLIFPPIEPL